MERKSFEYRQKKNKFAGGKFTICITSCCRMSIEEGLSLHIEGSILRLMSSSWRAYSRFVDVDIVDFLTSGALVLIVDLHDLNFFLLVDLKFGFVLFHQISPNA